MSILAVALVMVGNSSLLDDALKMSEYHEKLFNICIEDTNYDAEILKERATTISERKR